MLKKLVFTGLIGLGGAMLVGGTACWSYLRTGYREASDAVSRNVPIDWEIKRAQQMIDDLKPEIAKNMQIVACEESDIQRLSEDIDGKQAALAKARKEILQLKGDLESGSVRFVYLGRKYSADQVREDLACRFKQFQVHEKSMEKLGQVLAAREKNLDAARRKLDEMIQKKKQLEVDVANLRARLTLVEVAQAASPVALDDSHLSHTKELLDSIRTRIDVAERIVASEGILDGAIALEESASPELLNEISSYFGQDSAESGQGVAEVESLVVD